MGLQSPAHGVAGYKRAFFSAITGMSCEAMYPMSDMGCESGSDSMYERVYSSAW